MEKFQQSILNGIPNIVYPVFWISAIVNSQSQILSSMIYIIGLLLLSFNGFRLGYDTIKWKDLTSALIFGWMLLFYIFELFMVFSMLWSMLFFSLLIHHLPKNCKNKWTCYFTILFFAVMLDVALKFFLL